MAQTFEKNSDSTKSGLKAEKLFIKIAKDKECFHSEASTKDNKSGHIDCYVKICGKKYGVDVKSRKRISRKDKEKQDDFFWLELRNGNGGHGWIFGEADFIAFETEESFLLIFREDLKNWCKEHVDTKKIVSYAKNAYKVCYKRFKKRDLLTLIKREDLEKMVFRKWKK